MRKKAEHRLISFFEAYVLCLVYHCVSVKLCCVCASGCGYRWCHQAEDHNHISDGQRYGECGLMLARCLWFFLLLDIAIAYCGCGNALGAAEDENVAGAWLWQVVTGRRQCVTGRMGTTIMG